MRATDLTLVSSLPLGSPAKSPRQRSVGAVSFYGTQKLLYLTPLERKLVKEIKAASPPLPPPPPAPALLRLPPPPPLPKPQAGKKQRPAAAAKQKKKKGTASAHAVKMAMKSCMAPPKRISLKNLSRRCGMHSVLHTHATQHQPKGSYLILNMLHRHLVKHHGQLVLNYVLKPKKGLCDVANIVQM